MLLTLCLPVVALADVAGTGTMQITHTDPYYARTGTDTFLPGTYEVLGHSLDLATLVGSVDFTAAAPTVFSLAHATFNFEAVAPMSGPSRSTARVRSSARPRRGY